MFILRLEELGQFRFQLSLIRAFTPKCSSFSWEKVLRDILHTSTFIWTFLTQTWMHQKLGYRLCALWPCESRNLVCCAIIEHVWIFGLFVYLSKTNSCGHQSIRDSALSAKYLVVTFSFLFETYLSGHTLEFPAMRTNVIVTSWGTSHSR